MENQQNQTSYTPAINSQPQGYSGGNYSTNQNVVVNVQVPVKTVSKWAAFFLCLFFGYIGAHKFYEGKTGMGLLYLFTGGLFCIGWFVDTIILLFKPSHYTV